jgi:hypothetical protein
LITKLHHQAFVSERYPVARFHKENVVGMRVEQCRAIAAEIEVADWIGVGSVLLPHEEQRKEFMYTLSAANRKGHSLPADRRRSEAPH